MLVERGQRLVEQQHARLGDGGARQRHALLLAAGKLRRQAVGELGQPDLLHHRRRLALWRSALDMPRTRSAKATLSRTIRCGNSA